MHIFYQNLTIKKRLKVLRAYSHIVAKYPVLFILQSPIEELKYPLQH